MLYARTWPIDIAEEDVIEVDDLIIKPKITSTKVHSSYDGI
jgi:hypothetical protein